MKRNSEKYGLFWMFVLIFCLIFSMSIPAQKARHAGQKIRRLATAKNGDGVIQERRNETLDAQTGTSAPISLPIVPATKYDSLVAPEYTKLVHPSNQEPGFTYSFTYPIPPSYSVRYFYPQYVPYYSVPIGKQAIPRGYQLPSLFVQDTAAYNRAKLAEIEARKVREQYEQQKPKQVTGAGETIYEDIPYTYNPQEASREEQSTQLIVVEEKPPTVLKLKTKDVEAEALGLSAAQFQQLLAFVKSQKAQEMAFWQNILRVLFELLGLVTGAILLGYTIKWAMQKKS